MKQECQHWSLRFITIIYYLTGYLNLHIHGSSFTEAQEGFPNSSSEIPTEILPEIDARVTRSVFFLPERRQLSGNDSSVFDGEDRETKIHANVTEIPGNKLEEEDLVLIDLVVKYSDFYQSYCGYIPSCAGVGNQRVISRANSSEEQCCIPCSCEDNCSQDGTCCVDKWNVLEEGKFENFTVLYMLYREKLGNAAINNTAAKPEFNASENMENEGFLNMHLIALLFDLLKANATTSLADERFQIIDTSCVLAQLVTNSPTLSIPSKDVAYEMITTCFSSDTTREERALCEDKSSVVNDLTALIPVTSNASKKSYRNVYCLRCNERSQTEYVTWRSLEICNAKNVQQQFIENPVGWFDSVISKQFTYCNIVFEPQLELSAVVKKCKYADVSSCAKNSETTMPQLSYNTFATLCEQIYSPIAVVKLRREYNIFRNFGCYLCNGGQHLDQESCYFSYPTFGEYLLEINTKDVENLSIPLITVNDTARCNAGYIFDEITASCRQVLCPKHHFMSEGRCAPSILRTYGVFYSLLFNITPVFAIDNRSRSSEQTVPTRYVFELVSKSMSTRHFSAEIINSSRSIILKMNINSLGNFYEATLLEVKQFIQRVSQAEVQVGDMLVKFRIDVIDKPVTHKKSRQRREEKEVKDILTQSDGSRSRSEEKQFSLSKRHLCYRIQLEEHEIRRVSKYGIKIKRTGKLLMNEVPDDGFTECVDDFIGQGRRTATSNVRRRTVPVIPVNVPVLATFVGAAVLVSVVVVVRVCDRLIKQRPLTNKTEEGD